MTKIIESIEISKSELIEKEIKIKNACIVEYNYPEYFDKSFRRKGIFPDRKIFKVKICHFIKGKSIVITNNG